MKTTMLLLAFFSTTILSGCESGMPLSYNSVTQNIHRNVTTEQQIRQLYGEPSSTYTDSATGIRTLVYEHVNSNAIKKPIVGILGSIAGGVIGNHIGGGLGQDIATVTGAAAGGALAQNAVTARTKTDTLTINISLTTGRVIDYQYAESGQRSQAWRPSSGVGTL